MMRDTERGSKEARTYDNRPTAAKVVELAKRRKLSGYTLQDFTDEVVNADGETIYRTLETAVVIDGQEVALVRTTRKGRVKWIDLAVAGGSFGIGG